MTAESVAAQLNRNAQEIGMSQEKTFEEVLRTEMNRIDYEMGTLELRRSKLAALLPGAGQPLPESHPKEVAPAKPRWRAVKINGAAKPPNKQKQYFANRLAAGLCYFCPKKAMSGRKLCVAHTHRAQKNAAAMRAKKKA